MPFTFAHPVITMPWWKKKSLPVSALIIGCMAPDFEYFIRFRAAGVWGHEGPGILLFNLPLILLLYVVFEKVIRLVLHDYLPSWFPYRWQRDGKLPASPTGWMAVILLGLAGVGTHLLWDQFTHKGAWIVNQIPLLTEMLHIGTVQIPVYKLGQHGSTLLGLVLTAWWVHRHLYVSPTKRAHANPVKTFWCVFVAVYILVMFTAMMTVAGGEGLSFVLQLVVPAISSFLIALLVTCLLFWNTARRK
ncbi:DUF4184 family protein [Paenibacillus sp. HGF5]|uniref:DUF4184 family protein n=1 Tax=Paenibacillus sp. HGF5 TaxID=908341 RepID=UPI0002072602|nr:DUF4184 family protein [Paenibacillus sp. HGF5]EGG35441.1 hypothetical protein HMPREF9412_5593 [Paenibacillus sp. HGF5]